MPKGHYLEQLCLLEKLFELFISEAGCADQGSESIRVEWFMSRDGQISLPIRHYDVFALSNYFEADLRKRTLRACGRDVGEEH